MDPVQIEAWKNNAVTEKLFKTLQEREEEIVSYLTSTEQRPESLHINNRLLGTLDAIRDILSLDVLKQ